MLVRIIKCDRPTLWYYDAIGIEIEVKSCEHDGFWEVIDENNTESCIRYVLREEDFEIIEI